MIPSEDGRRGVKRGRERSQKVENKKVKRSAFLEEEDSRKRRKMCGTEMKVNKRDKGER
jgi:hypothetical protein